MVALPKEVPFVLTLLVGALTWLFTTLDEQSKGLLIVKFDTTVVTEQGKSYLDLSVRNLSRQLAIPNLSVAVVCPGQTACVAGKARETVIPGGLAGDLSPRDDGSEPTSAVSFSANLPQGASASARIPLSGTNDQFGVTLSQDPPSGGQPGTQPAENRPMWIVHGFDLGAEILSRLTSLYLYVAIGLGALVVILLFTTRTPDKG